MDELRSHGDGVYSVVLSPERRLPKFRAGNFLHLALDDYDPSGFWPDSRAFSIASPPAQRNRIELCYSVQGRFTERMERELAVGRGLWVKLPYGEFYVASDTRVVLIAGGTGFTAFASHLRQMGDGPHSTVILYGARSRSLLVFEELVRATCERLPMCRGRLFVEGGQDPLPEDADAVVYRRGRLTLDDLGVGNPASDDTRYYLAGPPDMITAIRKQLRSQGIPEQNIHLDEWS